jgi:hypothetical protein
MNVIAIGCSALKYTVSIDAYIMDSKTNRQIVFALMIFCIASMITASVVSSTNNANNNNNNSSMLAFAKKKKSSSSSSSTTGSSGGTDTTTKNPKTKTKKIDTSSSSSTTTKVKKPKNPKKTDLGVSSSSSTSSTTSDNIPRGGGGELNGNNGGPGGSGDTGGKGGAGGTPTGVLTGPPEILKPPKCSSDEKLQGDTCVPKNPKPPKCSSHEMLKNGVCVPKTTIPPGTVNPPTTPTCKDNEILKDGACVPKPVDCTLTPTDPSCKTPVDCSKTPTDPSCPTNPPVDCTKDPTNPKCTCPIGQHKDPTGKCIPNTCPDGSTFSNGACHCPPNEHFNGGMTKCIINQPSHPSGPSSIHISNKFVTIINTVVVKQSFKVGVPSTVVHDFTEFTNNPTDSKVIIILPTKNVQDATTKDMNVFGTILNTGSGTAKNIGQVSATVFDKDNNTLATLTAIPQTQTLRTQSTTTYQLVIPSAQVKLTDIRYIEFELVSLRSGSATVASSSSS